MPNFRFYSGQIFDHNPPPPNWVKGHVILEPCVFSTGRAHINEKKIIQSKSYQNRYYTSWYVRLIKSYLLFLYLGIDLQDDLKSLN